jgi:hypothetical protein
MTVCPHADTRRRYGAEGMADPSRLAPFVGEWGLEARFPGAPRPMHGSASWEWALGGRFLVQRADGDHPDAPGVLAVIAPDAEGDGFRQHYFDSRGVVRLYAMTLEDGVWTLLREEPDFTPLSFSQRYVGAFSADGDVISGRWETGAEGGGWKLDFELDYRRR